MAALSQNYKLRCSVDEPIQRLMEKLSAKSPDLYIFWQNYNQLYSQYADRVAEVETLRIEVDRHRTEADRLRIDCDRLRAFQAEHRCPVAQPIHPQYPPPQPVIIEKSSNAPNNEYELASLKEKIWTLQRQTGDLKHDCEHWKQQADELSFANDNLVEENRNFQVLLKQFKTENAVQKQNIDHIVARLKEAEIDLQGSRTSRSNQDQLNEQLTRYKQNEDAIRKALQEKQTELQMVMVSVDEMRATYERMLADAVRSIKGKLIESLPGLIEQSRTVKHLRYTSDMLHRP